MGSKKFSFKEAIAHGWAMTKKYFLTLLMIAGIYILFNVLSGVMNYYAGSDQISRSDISDIFQEPETAKRFLEYLVQEGIIDQYGRVSQKVDEFKDPSAFGLPPEFEPKRKEIHKIFERCRYRLPFPKPVFYVFTVALWLIGMVMGIGYTKMFLMLSRDEKPSAEELFVNWNYLIPYLLGAICYGLAVMGGMILLIVPGIILAIMLQMYIYLIIDKGYGPIVALKRSRVITKGSRWQLFLFGGLLLLLNIAGFLCLLIGAFFTMSISSIAMAYVYDRLEHSPDVTPVQSADTGS